LFNNVYFDRAVIPWHESEDAISDDRAKVNVDPELVKMRLSDPVKFMESLFEITRGWGYRAIGFKFMYWHKHKVRHEVAANYLASDKSIRIVHLKRRNLLRRFLSLRKAEISDLWSLKRDEQKEPFAQPPVELPIVTCIEDINTVETKQAEYDERFKNHSVLELFYEDLAHDPLAVGARAVAFLGLEAHRGLDVQYQKIGTESLRDAIVNYDELKASIHRWASFFDE